MVSADERSEILRAFLDSLNQPIGSKGRCRFYIGEEGSGKTSLLLDMEKLAWENDFIPVRVTAGDWMNEEIIETLLKNGTNLIEPEWTSFRTKLSILCEEIDKQGKGVLLLIDDAEISESMRILAGTYQLLIGDEMNLVLIAAGEPQSINNILFDDSLGFLNRGTQYRIK